MSLSEPHPYDQCSICGSKLYATDHGNHEATYHCSSTLARFWDYERGSDEQREAKEHWDKSKVEVFIEKS